VQVAFPVKVLYFPAAHAAHGFPFGPVDPALQVQSVIAELELAELELAGHAEHGLTVLMLYNVVISACVNTLLYIRISPICPINPRQVSPLLAIVKSLNLGNFCPVSPVPVALFVPSTYNIVDTGLVSDNV